MLTPILYALALATSGCGRSCSPVFLSPSDLCHVQNGGGRRASHQLNGSVLFVEGLVYDFLRSKIGHILSS